MANFLFKGFSTISGDAGGSYVLEDIDLVNQDLLNRFNIRLGECVMRPDQGCSIWNYLEEQMTTVTVDQITAEATRVCNQDSRLEVVDLSVISLENGIRIEIVLNYIPYNSIGTFITDFNTRQDTYSASLGEG